jgi:hypothetical protein
LEAKPDYCTNPRKLEYALAEEYHFTLILLKSFKEKQKRPNQQDNQGDVQEVSYAKRKGARYQANPF